MKYGASIEAKEYPISKVFSSDYSFVIPNYQRPYSWEIDQVEALLDDISYFAFQEDSLNDSKPYFLGSIVLIKNDKSSSQVVDGQQRLTTLTILLAAMRELLADRKSKDALTNFIYDKEDFIAGTKDNYRLQLGKKDQEFFNRYIQKEEGLKELPKEALLRDSQSNIRNNALYFLSKIEELYSSDEIRKLAAYIAQKCYLVVVSTPDEESAFRIFSVLNDRGMQLSNADILKAEIIGEIPGDEQDSYSDKWEEQEEDLGRDDFNSLFAYIRMIHLKTKPKETILKEIRNQVKPKSRPKEFIDKELIPYAQAFRDIKNTSFESSSNAEKINQYFNWLNRLDNKDWVPPALSYSAKWSLKDSGKIVEFLSQLERLAFGGHVLRLNINERIERYGKVLSAIENEEQDPDDLKVALSLSDDERKKIIEALNDDIYHSQFAKYLLLRLDEEISDGSAYYNYPVISIEHVLPQNPKHDSQWIRNFPDEEERIFLTNCLGNLVLLSRRKNSMAQNYEFEKKKESYFKKDGRSPFSITNEVTDFDNWTPTEIISRQKELVDKCIEIWKLV
jgi:uncharacterized protein with ParB-like and HNH nuclease domain